MLTKSGWFVVTYVKADRENTIEVLYDTFSFSKETAQARADHRLSLYRAEKMKISELNAGIEVPVAFEIVETTMTIDLSTVR